MIIKVNIYSKLTDGLNLCAKLNVSPCLPANSVGEVKCVIESYVFLPAIAEMNKILMKFL